MRRYHTVKKKYIPKLPKDFQELLIASELELKKGITVQSLRTLVYLYTRGMQYYDLVHKDNFRQFYSEQLVSLLTRKDVEQFLDKNPINFDDKKDLDKLFSEQNKKKVSINNIHLYKEPENTNSINDNNQSIQNFAQLVRRNSLTVVKNKMNVADIRSLVKKKVLEASTNLNKIDQKMTNEVIEQMTVFESRKRQKKVRKSNKNKEKKDDVSLDKINNNEEQDNNNIILSNEDELKILELSGINNIKKEEENKNKNKNKISIGNNDMLIEIELYVKKSMDEMDKALEELKASFEDEIKEAEENGFDDIAEGLKEDLQNELDNLKDQYDEQRRVETEKIKLKYSKKNSGLIK